jgi:caa(3)-type oxidase subunit IV
MEPIKKKTEGYRLYITTFILLSVLTLLAVGLTHVRFATPLAIGLILLVASVQAFIVLVYNMHLKFHDKILTVFVIAVFVMIVAVILVTLVDYIFR